MLNPPSAFPGVFNQTSCLTFVHSPVLKVHEPRPIDMPSCELQSEE